ncbi:MAG: PAS domain S-box protein [Sporocytophaga sp.]|uniref:PAS domain-containing sensor histidine kinase n=1 Tax=Sporocytophaga sp. TaxID=2231183 RepID=UPI001AFE56FA|nr:PAS domain S-box protein [Sporocytophaga sp.]MBO9699351.1 PAS domain S-box protein [Sporocytophaga sp.]
MIRNNNASVQLAEMLARHEQLGYLLLDSDLRIYNINSEAEDIFCIAKHNVLECLITDLFPSLRDSEHFICINEALNGNSKELTEANLNPFSINSRKVFRFSYLPFMADNDEGTGVLMLVKNLTQAEEAINPAGKKFEFMMDEIDIGIWEVDMTGHTLYLNKSMCAMLNLSSIDDIKEKTYYQFFTQRSIEAMRSQHQARLSDVASVFEGELISKNGDILNVMIHGSPIFDSCGKVKGYIGTFTDITSKINYQRELKNSEERFRMLFEKSHRANLISKDRKITLVNDALLKKFGYDSIDELRGKSPTVLLSPQSVETINERITKIDNQEEVEPTFELIFSDKAGVEFPGEVEITYFELEDGKSTHISIKDITVQKLAEEEIKNSEAKFRSLFNTQMIGIAFADSQQKIVEVNAKFLEIIKYTKEQFHEKEMYWMDLTPTEYLWRDELAVEEFMKNGFITPYEKVYIRRDGSKVPVLIASAKLEGIKNLGVGFVIDVSELKKSREETNKIAEELSKFLYMASHDLKGPLASVIGLTMVAKGEVTDAKAIEYFSLIEKCTKKLDSSLLNLMKIIRIKGNVFEFVEIDFNKLVPEVLDTLIYQQAYDLPKFELNVNLKAPFFSDEELLVSIFQNLFENSIKYKSLLRKLLIKVTVRDTNDDGIEIFVEDNGRGINSNIINRIFDMFYRGDSDSKGSGLGLYIVQNGIEKFNGSISVRNIESGGAEFHIILPRDVNRS